MANANPQRRGLLPVLMAVAAAIAIVLLTQRALAEQLGRWIAGLWVSTMAAVMSILGAFLGG